jgi:hypothetical protein
MARYFVRTAEEWCVVMVNFFKYLDRPFGLPFAFSRLREGPQCTFMAR